MKKIIVICTIAASAAQAALFAGTFVTDVHELANRGLASTPRAREEFPALTRSSVAAPANVARPNSAATVAAALGGPRLREEFPQLDRTGRPRAEAGLYAGVTNRGLGANPRAAEENPQLVRTPAVGAEFQVAPLK